MFKSSRCIFSTMATSKVSLSFKSKTTIGTSCKPAFCAANHLLSPATISYVSDEELFFLTPIPLILLPAVLALFYGVMQMYNSLHWNNSKFRVLFFTSSWIIFELLRSFLFTGFPWGLIAYSWSWSIQFVQIISVIGVYGLSFLTILCSALIGLSFIKKENFIFLIISFLILILLFSYGHIRIKNYSNSYHDNQYRIVHTNFDQKEKWKKENIEKMASNGSSDLITIFPETAFGMYNKRNSNWFIGYIREENGDYFNSIGFSNKIYDKKKLVPFGEYIPYERQLEILGLKNFIFMGSMRSGKAQQDFVDNFLPLICYESVFPNFVRKSIKKETELIINISNDAWFGEGIGPQQHFTHTRFRSIEHGITLIRSANKGISALVVNPVITRSLSRADASRVLMLTLFVPETVSAAVAVAEDAPPPARFKVESLSVEEVPETTAVWLVK